MVKRVVRATALLLSLVGLLGSPATSWAAARQPKPTGALAYHRDSGSFGYSVNAKDSRAARLSALEQCGHPKCEIVASIGKDCAAVANGPKKFVASRGTTRQEAETRSLRLCGERCTVVGWACSR